jgi:hypothetical protein
VRVNEDEISRLAAFLQLIERDFIERHTRLRHDRRGLVLQEQSDGACAFLDGNQCIIQPVKPQQCRDFPNLWTYPGSETYCRAIPREVSAEEYIRLVSQATQRTPESVREILRRTTDDGAPASGPAS